MRRGGYRVAMSDSAPSTAPGASTCWTVIRGAAAGRVGDREVFARRYAPVVRAYLRARWKGTPLIQDVDDAVQDVFVDCFKKALERVEEGRPGGFQAFLFGVTRNVALMAERRRARKRDKPASLEADEVEAADPNLSVVFDRAFAVGMVREAAALQRRRARESGDGAAKRVELLQLRFQEGLPIREIAKRWGEDPARLHHEYAKARREFRAALVETASFHHGGGSADVERECARLLDLFD